MKSKLGMQVANCVWYQFKVIQGQARLKTGNLVRKLSGDCKHQASPYKVIWLQIGRGGTILIVGNTKGQRRSNFNRAG